MQTKKQKEWYLKNKQLTIDRAKKWKKENPEKIKKSFQKYYKKNKQKLLFKNKIWKKNHYIKKPRKSRDLTNKKFGRLIVLSLSHISKNRDRFWNCECFCGNYKIVSGISLIHNRIKSCGCLQKEIISNICKKRIGNKSPCWKNDDISYSMIHQWLRKNFKKEECLHCKIKNKTLDFALINGKKHSRNRKNYKILCRKCHIAYDKK